MASGWCVQYKKDIFVSLVFVRVPEGLLISAVHVSPLIFGHMQLEIGFV